MELILNQQMNNIFESNGNTWAQLSKNIGLKQEKNRGNKVGPSVLTEGTIIKGNYYSLRMLNGEGVTQVPDIKSRLSFAQ